MLYYFTHPKLKTLFLAAGSLVLLGVILFSTIEGWSIVDALYFTVATMTTVGYGDLAPSHDISKVLATMYMFFTVPFMLISIGLITEVVHDNIAKSQRHLTKKHSKRRKKK
jgi:voltage-gated potassium channel Kch